MHSLQDTRGAVSGMLDSGGGEEAEGGQGGEEHCLSLCRLYVIILLLYTD